MVAAGASSMTATEEGSTNVGLGTSAQTANQTSYRYNNVQPSQVSSNSATRRTSRLSCSDVIKSKSSTPTERLGNRLGSKTESRDSLKNLALNKSMTIRETKASRLRAASIGAPNGSGQSSSRTGETSVPWSCQSVSSTIKEAKSLSLHSSSSSSHTSKEKDRNQRRKSYLNRVFHVDDVQSEQKSKNDNSEQRSRKLAEEKSCVGDIAHSETSTSRQHLSNLQRKHSGSKDLPWRTGTKQAYSRTKVTPTSSSSHSSKSSNSHLSGINNYNDSEVSRRVDALTALTKATMERVERLTSNAPSSLQYSNNEVQSDSVPENCQDDVEDDLVPISPNRCSILKRLSDDNTPDIVASRLQQGPISILKHKTFDSDGREFSSNSSHVALPVTFSPSVIEPLSKRHGILKKRSSLDESEILRRRSCSPDLPFIDPYLSSDFRPILKNQRRSSLDEIVKRSLSPDPYPTSILKRKSSREDECEEYEKFSLEPQSILKRKMASHAVLCSVSHHVTISTNTQSSSSVDSYEGSEVRPILKKKYSKEESSSSDPPSLEPRPILKKKSSTESDEQDERPKKTILKCSRVNSQEEAFSESDLSSPKKLNAVRNRLMSLKLGGSYDADCVRSILKQSGSREGSSRPRLNFCQDTSYQDGSLTDYEDAHSRKRAQSIGHVHSSTSKEELATLFSKRRSFDVTSLQDFALKSYPLPLYDDSESTHNATSSNNASDVASQDMEDNPGDGANINSSVSLTSYCQRNITVVNTSDNERFSRPLIDSRQSLISSTLLDASSLETPARDDSKPENSESKWSSTVLQAKMHFKTLVAKGKAETKSNQRGHRERKEYSDRFSTQPITFQEVQEAKWQNQKQSSEPENRSTGRPNADDEFDPSKLSIAERVRLFNLATPNSSTKKEYTRDKQRRPISRHKTQPVTLEEVEVATRLSRRDSSPANCLPDVGLDSNSSDSVTNVPKSILKFPQGNASPQSESPELEGFKLLRSVLKRESEGAKQCDTFDYNLWSKNLVSKEEDEVNNEIENESKNSIFDSNERKEDPCDSLREQSCKPRNIDITDGPVQSCIDTVKSKTAAKQTYKLQNACINQDSIFYEKYNPGNHLTRPNMLSISKSASHHTLNESSTTTALQGEQLTRHRDVTLSNLPKNAAQQTPANDAAEFASSSIAERLAALQKNGTTGWKQRLVSNPDLPLTNNKFPEKISGNVKQSILADRLGKLECAAEGWKKRVAAPDAIKFSVAGKMKVEQSEALYFPASPLTEKIENTADKKRRRPKIDRFYGKKGEESLNSPNSAPVVTIPRADNETFTSFFSSISWEKCESECFKLEETDLDSIVPSSEKLVQKRTTRTQRRRWASKNPLKTLATRTDLKEEYVEINTGIADKMMKSLNAEKISKNSTLAVEALAGLSCSEDFSAITLRNVTNETADVNKLPPYKNLMLILIKGRRHVQARLVEPVASSVNSGDSYILVTKKELYHYIGKYSNVIEKARGTEMAQSIVQMKDLGCHATEVITIDEEKPTYTKMQFNNFWRHLKTPINGKAVEAGHPDEDELFESAMVETNMAYEVINSELVPIDKYWGSIPKIEMLTPNRILLFDFGSEMYIWSGKMSSAHKKKLAAKLSEELWSEGYDYTDCTACPVDAASLIGKREKTDSLEKKRPNRPDWCLFAKLTQHMETVLFREKFLDWPKTTGVIRMKGSGNDQEMTDKTIVVEPPNAKVLIETKVPLVDMILEGYHLGRGTGWYDEEEFRQYVITTVNVKVWHVDEFSHTVLKDSLIGHFYSGDSYIIRWMYTVTVTGRELSGLPSKHSAIGRDRTAYFIWQGRHASLNEQGTAALLTVELDLEQGPQVRVVQGFEPAAFLNLLCGKMVIHSGNRIDKVRKKWKLYICRGSLINETSLIEVPCSMRQLRSRASFVLLNTESGKIYVWHGNHSLPYIKQNAVQAANNLRSSYFDDIRLISRSSSSVQEIHEGEEPSEVFEGGINRDLYLHLETKPILTHTPRLFHLLSVSKELKCTEVLCAHRSHLATPYPFLQEELYQVNQPGLFLMDNMEELWIWQGWWPDNGDEDQTGSRLVRWQAERRAAMTLALQYWKTLHPTSTQTPVYLVWAGLEPLQFTNLFPTWENRDDVAELNIKDGRECGEVLLAEDELARLTQSTYPAAQLLQRPLPEGVDPTRLELYLSPQHFQELLGMSREAFEVLPSWKQVNLKKSIGLF